MNCPICEEEVSMAIEHFMVAIDIPYFNVFFHPACYKNNIENLHKIIELWYNIHKDDKETNKNGITYTGRTRRRSKANDVRTKRR